MDDQDSPAVDAGNHADPYLVSAVEACRTNEQDLEPTVAEASEAPVDDNTVSRRARLLNGGNG